MTFSATFLLMSAIVYSLTLLGSAAFHLSHNAPEVYHTVACGPLLGTNGPFLSTKIELARISPKITPPPLNGWSVNAVTFTTIEP